MQKTALRLKAAVYIRVSTSKQEKWSPDAQRRVLLEHCERMGWDPVIYSETGSGETLEGRPQIQRLLKDATAKQFSLCLVVEQERLSRDKDLMDWLVIVKTFRDAGIQLATPNQTYDLADSEGSFLTNLFGVLAAREKHKMLERTQRGRKQAKAAGKYLNEWLPYGWMIQDGKYVLHPEESERVRWMATTAQTHSRRFVAQEMTRMGYATKTGLRRWDGATVNHLLKNPVLYGELRWGGETYQIPPIISKGEWLALQERFKTRWCQPRRYSYLLKGILFCSLCGRNLYGSSTQYRYHGKRQGAAGDFYRYYTCRGRASEIRDCKLVPFRCESLEATVWGHVKTFLKSPKLIYDAITLVYEERGSRDAAKGQEEARIARQLDGLTKEETRLVRAFYGSGSGLTEENFRLALEEIRRDRHTLEIRRKEVAETQTPDVKDLVSLKSLKTACAQVAEGIDAFDWEAQREILTLLVDRVTLYADYSAQVRCRLPIVQEMKHGVRPGPHHFEIRIPPIPRTKRGPKPRGAA